MTRSIIYLAVSLDGFIADEHGGIAWLLPYDPERYGYAEFFARVQTLVMGAKTYEQVLTLGPWPYEGKQVVVLTHRELPKAEPSVEFYAGEVRELMARLRQSEGDIWIEGGADVIAQLLAAHEADELWLFIIPVLLGDGIRLFRAEGPMTLLELLHAAQYPDGVVQLRYALRDRPGPAPNGATRR